MTARRCLTLHIGQTKAGSTSLQNWMDAQREELLKQGILFPASVLGRGNASDQERSSGQLELLRRLASGDLVAFEAELAAHPATHVVLSIENLFFDRLDSELTRVREYFRDWNISLIAVLRPQLDWLRSRHTEDVMSGFKCATYSLPTLAQQTWDQGVLDYRARLAHVAGLLGTTQVQALRFDDPDQPLVPRLLAALGIAFDPDGDAATIHANRRERDPALVEAKRRLNPLIRRLSLQPRLRIEHELRQIARAQQPDHSAPLAAAGLDPVQIAALQASNDALFAEGILDQPLDTGQPDNNSQAVPDTDRQQKLFERGLLIAAQVAWQDEAATRRADLVPGLTAGQITTLCTAIRRNSISLHLGHAAGAQLAAAHDGHLAVFLTEDAHPWQLLTQLDAVETPSPLVALAPGDAGWADLRGWLASYHLPLPDLVVVGPSCSPEHLAAAVKLEPAEVFLWPGHELAEPLALQDWIGEEIGRALHVRRSILPQTTAQRLCA